MRKEKVLSKVCYSIYDILSLSNFPGVEDFVFYLRFFLFFINESRTRLRSISES